MAANPAKTMCTLTGSSHQGSKFVVRAMTRHDIPGTILDDIDRRAACTCCLATVRCFRAFTKRKTRLQFVGGSHSRRVKELLARTCAYLDRGDWFYSSNTIRDYDARLASSANYIRGTSLWICTRVAKSRQDRRGKVAANA